MQAMQRAVRALRKTRIGNENDEGAEKMYKVVLTGVVLHADYEEGKRDTTWLERELKDMLRISMKSLQPRVEG